MSGGTLFSAAAAASGLTALVTLTPALQDLAADEAEPPSAWMIAAAALGLLVAGYGALLGASLQLYSPTKIARRLKNAGPEPTDAETIPGADVLRDLAAHDAADQATAGVLQTLGLIAATLLTWVATPPDLRGLAVAVLAFACLVLVGLLPARLAESRAEDILLRSFGVLRQLRWVLLVATLPARAVVVAILRLLRIPEDGAKDRQGIAEEIIAAVGDSSDEGGIEQERRDWIEAIVQMKDKSASEIKTPRTDIVAFEEQQPLIEAVREAVRAGFSRYPVYRSTLDDVVGLFYVKDALDLLGHGKKEEFRTVGELMRKPLFAPESRAIVDLLREFRATKIQLAVLLDEYGGTSGIVSIEDILEEVFGEIVDEHDPEADEEIRVIEPGLVVEVSGRARVDDVNDEISQQLPIGEDYDTLAGFVISRLDRIPRPGEKVTTDGFEFEILAADDRRIGRLRLRVAPETEAAEPAPESVRGQGS